MLQARLLFVSAAALALVPGCLPADQALLCRGDDDCASDQTCEVVSGLCKPAAGASRFLPELAQGTFGASGAFDCPITGPGLPAANQNPGVATLTVGFDVQDGRPCSASALEEPTGERPKITGLRTGCVFTRDPSRGVGPDTSRAYVDLEFSQVDTTPSNPASRLKFTMRGDDVVAGEIPVGAEVHGTFMERCQDMGGSTELKLRAVVVEGSFEISERSEDRMQGRFDVKLALVEKTADQPFGGRCTLPRDCSDGCAFEELVSAECLSGTCIPAANGDSSGEGICSSACESTADCDGGGESLDYCLQRPTERFGQCIRVCDPSGVQGSCPDGQSCREGADFPDFLGSPGPARCVDECIPSPSASNPPEHCARPDAGTPVGPPPDGGPPPPDGGLPPPDGGVVVDAGVPTSALGQPCHAVNQPCPSGWVCGSVRLVATTVTGFCTLPCPGVGQDAMCQSGYAGPGVPRCGLTVRNTTAGSNLMACAVGCGAELGGDGSCTSPLTCVDRVDNTTLGQPPDGQPDFCVD